ncbi:MAG: PEP-CTERM sorting domain-containing protein [Myxococcota bacterium]
MTLFWNDLRSTRRRSGAQVGAALAFLTSLLAGAPALAVPSGLGFYSVGSVETSATASGDVVVVGDAVFVGSGGFGGAGQSIVRIDGSGETVIATGFNALAGFTYDAVNDRLLVGDNGLEAPGSVTGDTVYAIPSPFADPLAPPAASTLALLPDGAVPGVADLVLDPADPTGDTLLLSDASGSFPPAGEVLSLAIGAATLSSIGSGFAYTSGLAVDGDTLYVGEAALDFSGNVYTVDLGAPGGPGAPALLAGLPGGVYDLEVGADGFLYATTGGDIVRIDPGDGSLTTVATGFGFTGGLFAAADGRLFAVDGFAAPGEENRVWVFTPVPEPGTALLCGLGLALLARRRR